MAYIEKEEPTKEGTIRGEEGEQTDHGVLEGK